MISYSGEIIKDTLVRKVEGSDILTIFRKALGRISEMEGIIWLMRQLVVLKG